MGPLLEKVNYPSDIKDFSMEQLRQLCAEIREYMVEVCSENPGHLASSLGAVELIVGLHYVFDTPKDRIVFDVGHQAYSHKILTGRKEAFRKNRTREGISGFPKMSESEYDAFGVGHSSTSISAALGMAEAARIQGSDARSIAMIGDGALTGGLALEALNNAGVADADVLVILNDNNHSIDNNIGGLHEYLLKITSSRSYNAIKSKVWNRMGDNRMREFIQRWVKSFKSWMVKIYGGDIFESLGLRYFGPIEGNDIEQVVKTLQKLKKIHGPRVLHCLTIKGFGYEPAMADPTIWHAPGKFNPETGERIKSSHSTARYQDVFGDVLCTLAEKDQTIVGITPAMASGCGMNKFAEKFPDRFFDVGIEEEHAVTFSAGLAAAGMRPFCNIYSSFSQRAYDQIIHDVALQELPVVLCFDRAGLVGEDGATHNGAFDMAAYRSIPNAIISTPKDEAELRDLMFTASRTKTGPFIIRYPRGLGEGVDWKSDEPHELTIGKADELISGDSVAIVAAGPATGMALEAAARFPGKVGVYDFRFIKPLDTECLEKIASKYRMIMTVEEGSVIGGLYGAVCEHFGSRTGNLTIEGVGIPDRFIEQDRQQSQRAECGLDSDNLAKKIEKFLEIKNNI